MGVDANDYDSLGKVVGIIAKKSTALGLYPGRQDICNLFSFLSVLACYSCRVLEDACGFHIWYMFGNRFCYI